MNDVFVDRERLEELKEDPEFTAHQGPIPLVRCFYCGRVNAKQSEDDTCGTCNGPVVHGFPLAGAWHGDAIWLRPD